jgi:diguanylate cyclase (GGDEF)-like protein
MDSPPPPRILLIEDNEHDAFLLQAELRRAAPGACFARVETEAELRAALKSEWDLVICDHEMPQLDSERALNLINELGREVAFVIFSGHMEERVALQSMRLGAQDYIDKRDPARLIPVVERELRNAALRREKRAAVSSLDQLSKFDPLTRLPNRQSLEEVMRGALGAAAAADLSPAVLVLDLDRFMRINDSFGYAAGDELMRAAATRLQEAAGPGACVARLGEDEFAVLLPGNRDPGHASAAAQCIERAFSPPFCIQGEELYLSFSIGLARFPEHGTDPAALISNAESAMFRAKRRGGSRFQVYDPRISHGAGHRLKLENALRGVIAREELAVLYQPILDLKTRRVVATEALVRWHHPEFGLILPDQFIPLAEEAGLILEIGDWVLRQACLQTQAWRAAGHADLKIAVNISAEQFHDRSLAARVPAALAASGLEPSALELELTESVAMHDAGSAVAILRSLKALGVRIAIDDFGTGFSSLSYLKRFPIDILKIDKSFVRALPASDEDTAIVRMIMALGTSLGLILHAEGIETEPQEQVLRSLGCHRGQGYGFSRPLAAADAGLFLELNRAGAPAAREADDKIIVSRPASRPIAIGSHH